MSHVVSSSAPISSAHTVKAYSGFGILGADIPTTGDNGGSPVLNDGVTSTSEYHWRVETAPSDGDLTIYPDLSFIWDGTGVADGSYPWVYRLFEDGVSQGTATVSQTVGAAPQLLAPTGPATSTGWLSSTGGDLYTCVDEATADGADYVYTTTPGSVVEWTFPSGGAVSANGGFVRYQIPAGTGSVSVELRQGASLVQTLGTHTLTGSVQNIEVAITASTTDSVDLRVRFTGNA
ncbi:MAG: hypothetical protein KBH41_14375 [Azonexus sp.]|nr:hypothetical protein [Azonexus sp.]